MGSSCRSLAGAALILLPAMLSAQQRRGPLVLSGHLARVSARDTTLLARAIVVAHRVGTTRQGPIDSQLTGAGGAFRFVIARPESGSVYVVSTLYQGIGYFSEPVTRSSASLTLAVFDTSSSGPPLAVQLRNIVVTRGEGGARRVLDLAQIENDGALTRVGKDSGASWSTRLPEGVTDVTPGASDVPPSAIQAAGGKLQVSAPIPPGQKQVVVTYVLPEGRDRLVVPIDQRTAGLELLLEDSTAQPDARLVPTDPVTIEGHTFRRFTTDSLPAGAEVSVQFGAGRPATRWALPAAVAVAAVLLLVGAVAAVRGRSPAGAGADDSLGTESAERLIAQIAALDDRFQGREQLTPPEAWSRYRRRREELKRALERRLARHGAVSPDSSDN